MHPHEKHVRELKTQFDEWFEEVRKLFPETHTIEEENTMLEVIKFGRWMQQGLIDVINTFSRE